MSAGSGDEEPGAPAPWRWALVIVPLAVLAAGGLYLLNVWTASLQDVREAPRPAVPLSRQPTDDAGPSRDMPSSDWPPADIAPPRPEAPLDMAVVLMLLTHANPDDGARVFKMCAPCHTAEKGGPHRVGPNLWGIVGRPIAADPRFNSSAALKAKGGTWQYPELAAYLHNPRTFAPGTSMAFRGVKDEMRMANLLAYLGTLRE